MRIGELIFWALHLDRGAHLLVVGRNGSDMAWTLADVCTVAAGTHTQLGLSFFKVLFNLIFTNRYRRLGGKETTLGSQRVIYPRPLSLLCVSLPLLS